MYCCIAVLLLLCARMIYTTTHMYVLCAINIWRVVVCVSVCRSVVVALLFSRVLCLTSCPLVLPTLLYSLPSCAPYTLLCSLPSCAPYPLLCYLPFLVLPALLCSLPSCAPYPLLCSFSFVRGIFVHRALRNGCLTLPPLF
jgi:hypothetical protein